jgi:hypothetical protein
MVRVRCEGEKVLEVDEGPSGFCPKKKGGRRYQAEVLQEMCLKCRVKRKHCPEKIKGVE